MFWKCCTEYVIDQIKSAALDQIQIQQIKSLSLSDIIPSQLSLPSANSDSVSDSPSELRIFGVTDDLRDFVKGLTSTTFQNFLIKGEQWITELSRWYSEKFMKDQWKKEECLSAVVQKKPRQHVHGLVVVSYRSRGYQICKGTPVVVVSDYYKAQKSIPIVFRGPNCAAVRVGVQHSQILAPSGLQTAMLTKMASFYNYDQNPCTFRIKELSTTECGRGALCGSGNCSWYCADELRLKWPVVLPKEWEEGELMGSKPTGCV
uniref:Uncharacterized protein n=1 Tax=Fagus sylvatica TaxID=28930 RepID=A0A2N9GJH2_FAGSY